MGKGLTFRRRENPIPKGDMQSFFEEVCDEEGWRNTIGHVIRVRKLPEEWVFRRVRHLRYVIADARKEIALLRGMPTRKTR